MPKATAIRAMFEGIAPRYDLLNRVLSLGIDQGWRARVVSNLELAPNHRVVDLCCGTGDLALAIAPFARAFACDFTWNMLTRARAKAESSGTNLRLAAADALELPFPSGTFDRATVAFGVRNLEDMEAGFREIHRVLASGGVLAVLEFSRPHRWWLRAPYYVYLEWLLPAVGSLLSSRGEAYRYLAESIRGFPDPEVLVSMLERAGFASVSFERLTGGIVALHLARKT